MAKKRYSIADVAEEIQDKPKKRYSIADVAEEIPEYNSNEESPLKSFAQGSLQGVTSGFADEGAGALTAFDKAARDIFNGRVSPLDVKGFYEKVKGNYTAARDKYREGFDKSKSDNPKSYLGGQFAGAAAQSAIPGMNIAKGDGWFKSIGKMGALGALQGVGDNKKDENLGADIMGGALIGGVSGIIGKGLQALTDAKGLERAAGTNAAKALGYTKRFIKDGGGRASDVGKTMLDEGVVKAFASPDEMMKGIDTVLKKSGEDIGQFLRKKGSGYDTNHAISELEKLRPRDSKDRILQYGAYEIPNKMINEAINTAKSHVDGVIPFEEANKLKGILQKLVNWKSGDEIEKDVGKEIAATVRRSVDDSLENVSKNVLDTVEVIPPASAQQVRKGPMYKGIPADKAKKEFEQFLKNKKVYGAAQEAQDAIMDRLSKNFNKGVGLTDTIVLSGGLSNPAGSAAMYGLKKGAEKFGRATQADLQYKISKLIQSAPPAAQKYLPTLLEAGRRGTDSLLNTAYNLSNDYPEFAAILEEVQ